MRNKMAIFDLDGTLFDTCDANYYAYAKACRFCGFNFDISRDMFKSDCFGKNYKAFLPDILNCSISDMCKIHEEKKRCYPSFLRRYCKKNEFLFDIIGAIKNEYYIVTVTTAARVNAEIVMSMFDCDGLFDAIVTSEDVERLKPDPEGYLYAMKLFSIDPGSTMLFEDSDDSIETAIGLGISAYQVKCY